MLATSCRWESFDQKAAREAHLYTQRHLPMPVAEGVRLDSMTYRSSPRTLCYHYTLSDALDNAELIAARAPQLKAKLSAAARETVELKAYREKGVRLIYLYRSASSGRMLLQVAVSP